jgi:hypothetical protein
MVGVLNVGLKNPTVLSLGPEKRISELVQLFDRLHSESGTISVVAVVIDQYRSVTGCKVGDVGEGVELRGGRCGVMW